jgi:ATP-binding cassette subfamily F protein uup
MANTTHMISYLQVENLSKRYGELLLFENISFGIGKEQRIALIAKNGTGKTTLLDIIAMKDTPDEGAVTRRNDITIGYLEQNPEFDDYKTVVEQVFTSSNEVITAIKDYEESIKCNDKERIANAMSRMDSLRAWDYEVKVKQILSQLNVYNFDQLVKHLSGGQKKRLALANVLINEPDILILDEPTNHLDMDMIEWLEAFLAKSKSTLLMVTHDRYFLDKVCNEIIELEDNRIYTYKGNYAYYLEKREERIAVSNATIGRARALLKTEMEWIVRSPQARATKAKSRIDNFYKLEEQASQKIKKDRIELNIKTSRLGKKILEMYNISKRFDDLVLVDDFTYKFQRNEKVGIVGPNGCGKSTFLNLITKELKLDTGVIDVGETVIIGYYKQSGISLNDEKRVIDVIKDIAEVVSMGSGRKLSASQFLEYFLFAPEAQYGLVSKLSGGERRRLYLMTVLMRNPNFLLLDEPTNDLDIMTLNVMEDYLVNFNGCTLIVSHDRYFLDKTVDTVFVFEGNGRVKNYPGNYSYYRQIKDLKAKEAKKHQKQEKIEKIVPVKKNKKKFSYKEKREYETLEIELAELESEKSTLETDINSGTLSTNELTEKSNRFSEILETIDEKEFRWLELNELMES